MNKKKEDGAIHLAVRAGDVELVEDLLRDVCPNSQNSLGESPLHVACQFDESRLVEPADRLSILRLLWENGAKMNARGGHRRETALHLAVKSQQVELVRFLLLSGSNPNARDKEDLTAMHLIASARWANPDDCEMIVELLLQRGANLHAQDNRWRTPLIEAVCSGNPFVVQLLLKSGAQIDWRNRLGLSALFYACESQDLEMVGLLLDRGADANLRESRRRSAPLHFVAASGRHYTFAEDESGRNRSSLVAGLLLSHGADVNALDASGSSPLHLAVDTKDERLVELLLRAGAGLELTDEYGNTPLHVLLLTVQRDYGNEPRLARIARMLVRAGANVNNRNDKLETALHLAVYQGNADIVSELLANGADASALWHSHKGSLRLLHETPACNSPEVCGDNAEEAFTPLNVAAALGHLAVVQLLLDHGSLAERENFTGSHDVAKTPLYFAVKNARYQVAKLLLDAGCDVNRPILHNTTVLHVAVSKGNAALTYLLLEYGANYETKDIYGRTALTCAVEYGRESLEKIAKILVMHRVRREFRNLKTTEKDLEGIRSWQWLQDFRMDCVLELLKMKEHFLCDNISMYGIFSKKIDSLVVCLGNEDVVDCFVSENIEEKYPIYCDMLKIHFDLGLERREYVNSAKVVLNELFENVMKKMGFETLPDVIIQKILDYCNLKDLQKITLLIY